MSARAERLAEELQQVTDEAWRRACTAEHCTVAALACQAVALDRLRTQAPPAIAYVRTLSDEQLERAGALPFGGDPMTAEAVIAHVLIGHPRGHLVSMQAATA
jgi:hypothetical protein